MAARRATLLGLLCASAFLPLGRPRWLRQTQPSDLIFPQSSALLLVKASLDPMGTSLPSWSPATDPCTWKGLACNGQGQVTTINLANMGLSGQLPRDERVWGGLPAVTSVNLANNSIQGYAAPEMGQLHMIQDVNFEHNELSGPLPGLANLTQLTNLRLGSNQLSGTLPASWSGNTHLTNVNLSNNTLTGTLPPSWSSLSELQALNVSQNQFSGGVPSSWRQTVNGSTRGMRNLTSLLLGGNPTLCQDQYSQLLSGPGLNFSAPQNYQEPCSEADSPVQAPAPAPAPAAAPAQAPVAAPSQAPMQAPAAAPALAPAPAPSLAPAAMPSVAPTPASGLMGALSGPAPAPSAEAAAGEAPAPSPGLAVAGTPASPDLAAAQPQQAGGGGGRPGWQLGVIIAAVLAGLILAVCVVLVPYMMAKQRRKRRQEDMHQRVSASRKALGSGASTPRKGKPGSGPGGPGKMNGHGLNGHANGHAPSPSGSFEHKAGTDGLAPRSSGSSFASVDSNDSYRSAWSRLQSSFGSFTSARSVMHSAAGDREEPVFDPPGRLDSFVSAESFGQASSTSADSFMTAKSGTRDALGYERGARRSFSYTRRPLSTGPATPVADPNSHANPLYGQEDDARLPGQAPSYGNPLYTKEERSSLSAVPSHRVSTDSEALSALTPSSSSDALAESGNESPDWVKGKLTGPEAGHQTPIHKAGDDILAKLSGILSRAPPHVADHRRSPELVQL